MGQITVFSGAARRQQWSDEQKLGFVAAAFAPGAVVAEFARAPVLEPEPDLPLVAAVCWRAVWH